MSDSHFLKCNENKKRDYEIVIGPDVSMVMEKSLNFMSVFFIHSPPLGSIANISLDFVYSWRVANYIGLLKFKPIKLNKIKN